MEDICSTCLNSGFWLTPAGKAVTCPHISLGRPHPELPSSSEFFARAIRRLDECKIEIASQPFLLAQILVRFSSTKPASAAYLQAQLFAATNLSEDHRLRKLHAFIETLRNVWLLPVGSRKHTPTGYWIIRDLDDYKA